VSHKILFSALSLNLFRNFNNTTNYSLDSLQFIFSVSILFN
jgi:hypothetical protein